VKQSISERKNEINR